MPYNNKFKFSSYAGNKNNSDLNAKNGNQDTWD